MQEFEFAVDFITAEKTYRVIAKGEDLTKLKAYCTRIEEGYSIKNMFENLTENGKFEGVDEKTGNRIMAVFQFMPEKTKEQLAAIEEHNRQMVEYRKWRKEVEEKEKLPKVEVDYSAIYLDLDKVSDENFKKCLEYVKSINHPKVKSGRNIAKISEEDLRGKLLAVEMEEPPTELTDAVHYWKYDNTVTCKDLGKINFDIENVNSVDIESHGEYAYAVVECGGDWEAPIQFVLYWDGKNIRAYIPEAGNPYNRITKSAFGSEGDSDAENNKHVANIQKIVNHVDVGRLIGILGIYDRCEISKDSNWQDLHIDDYFEDIRDSRAFMQDFLTRVGLKEAEE